MSRVVVGCWGVGTVCVGGMGGWEGWRGFSSVDLCFLLSKFSDLLRTIMLKARLKIYFDLSFMCVTNY